MKYPQHSSVLINLLADDQADIKQSIKLYDQSTDMYKGLHDRSVQRAQKMMDVLGQIGAPTVDNIGNNGSMAVSVLAAHANVRFMKAVLSKFIAAYKIDENNIYLEAIPSLSDRVAIIERSKQLYGTQWMRGPDNKFYLYPVDNYDKMLDRRKLFHMDKPHHPINMADSNATNAPIKYASKNDQRQPSETEHQRFIEQFL